MDKFFSALFKPPIAKFADKDEEATQRSAQLIFEEEEIDDEEPLEYQRTRLTRHRNKPVPFDRLYDVIKSRTKMRVEAIDGFRFSFGSALALNFMFNAKYDLIGPQPQKQGQDLMQGMGRPEKKSKFSLDLQWISDRIPKPGAKPWILASNHTSGGEQIIMVTKQFGEKFTSSFQSQYVNPQHCQWTFRNNYEADDWVTTVSLGNVVNSFSYVQAIKRTMLGVELSRIGVVRERILYF